MTYFSVRWKPDKAARRLTVAKAALLPGEEVWYLGGCNNLTPLMNEIAVTPLRVVGLLEREIKYEARYSDMQSMTFNENKGTLDVVRDNGHSMTFKQIPTPDVGAIEHYARHGQNTPAPPELLAAQNAADAALVAAAGRMEAARNIDWPHTIVRGQPSRKASEAILRQCHQDEHPWLILTSGSAGTLVALEDRLAIIKTGGVTGFMAGALGGERSVTFHYVDITGIEYNSGFVTGVLEVLTPSYQGTANKDYWRGSNQSRNADSNDPWTLSNTLPLSKVEFNSYLTEINDLRSRIGRAKQVNVQVVAPQAAAPASAGLTEQLTRLAQLHSAGALTDEEFTAAKAHLLG
ncbi:SHOCT domain-containing protein [Promicromonospora sp. NPDC023987]|uniref:SHOCT domain-containing protein n=1 Tax=Promicromonospora sp. NPDC023987 TaxID=3155360 RepID=UPI0033DC7257